MTAPRDIALRLSDIVDSANKIESLVARGEERFRSEWQTHDLVVHHLEIMGEAAAALPREFRDRYRDVRWGALVGMRNHLIHGYSDIDYDIVWTAATVDCEPLGRRVSAILVELEDVTK